MEYFLQYVTIKNLQVNEIYGWIFAIYRVINYIQNWDWEISIWWIAISTISIINILYWIKTYNWFKKQTPNWTMEDSKFIRLQLFLSSGYVFVCAFRSFLPRADVQKVVIWDTWLSSILVGRSVATIGELCLAAQLAIFLFYLSKRYNSPSIKNISLIVFPVILIAEVFSWYSVLTTNYIGNTTEESLWCLNGFLLIISSLILMKKTSGKEKFYISLVGVYNTLYVIFMLTVDVPMYYQRFLMDSVNHKEYKTLLQGFHEINSTWYSTQNYIDWQGELSWMFLYFTTAVWVSLILIRTPLLINSISYKKNPVNNYLEKERKVTNFNF